MLYLTSSAAALILFFGSCHSAFATENLETIEITGINTGNPLNDYQSIQENLEAVPGGTNLISLEDKPSVITLTDALGNQPGIIVQEFFGGLDQPRLNIRGSGLQGNPVSRGVLIRENNLPLNEADGSFIMGTLDLKSAQAISVHRGANSRVPGAITLGGDINFIGDLYNEDINRIQVESGSFSQQSFLFDHKKNLENFTYRLGASQESAEGYRHHSASKKTIYRANTSWQVTPNLFNQIHYRHTELHFDMPFVLSKARAETDPQSVYGDGNEIFDIGLNMYARDPHRSIDQQRLTNQTKITHASSEHYLGVYWQKTKDAFVDPMSHIKTASTLKGLHYSLDHYPLSFLHYQLGLDYNRSKMPRNYFGNHPLNGNTLGHYASFDLIAKNTTASIAFDLTVLPEWILNGQFQYVTSERVGNKEEDNSRLNKRWYLSTPKLGVIYQPTHLDLRLFSNISKSKEIPTYWEFIGTSLNPVLTYLSEAFFLNLTPQDATTLEIGGQYKVENNEIDLTLYRSVIDKELMSTASQYGVIANTVNYEGNTIHQGIELGINGRWHPLDSGLIYAVSWNYSDFYFKNGPFADNRIAGVPKHVIGGELLYQSKQITWGPTITWVPGQNPADHKNTLDHDGYVLLGLKCQFSLNTHFKGFITINNLTDKNYNSAFVIREGSNPILPTFLPGNGMSIQAGLSFSLTK